MDNELALIRATGQGSGQFNETDISTILGEDDYMTYAYRKDVAQRTFTATSGIAQMAPEDMEQRFNEYDPIPGAEDFAAQQEIQAAVQKEIQRVSTLRANQPDRAALEYPEVAAAYQQLQQTMEAGDPPANEVQDFVRLMLETQAKFDIPPDARAPVPHDWAVEIGRQLGKLPEAQGRDLSAQKAAVIAQYTSLQQYFGDLTDEVLAYSISEYKGMSKPMADILSSYVVQLRDGTGIFRPQAIDSALDQEQVDSFSGYSSGGRAMLGPVLGPPVDAIVDLSRALRNGTQVDEGLSPEEQLRAAEATTEE
jgi:hypothetical protein